MAEGPDVALLPAIVAPRPPLWAYVSVEPHCAQRPPSGSACVPYSGRISPSHAGHLTAAWAASPSHTLGDQLIERRLTAQAVEQVGCTCGEQRRHVPAHLT